LSDYITFNTIMIEFNRHLLSSPVRGHTSMLTVFDSSEHVFVYNVTA